MTVQDALTRGYNLVGTAIVAITGFAFSQEFFFEDEVTHKIDEGVLFLIALGALAWYFIGNNKFSRTMVPLLLTAAALIMKLLAAFILETGDSADLGDDFSALLLFVIAFGFLLWQYIRLKRVERKEAIGVVGQ